MRRHPHLHKTGKLLFFLILTLVFSSCGAQAQTPTIRPSPVFIPFTPTVVPEAIATSVPVSTAPIPVESRIAESVPSMLREQVESLSLPAGAKLTLDISNSELTPNDFQIQWVYVLAAPFPTVRDGVSFDELRSAWNGSASPSLFKGQPILMDDPALAAFTALWGAPSSGSVRSVEESQLLDVAWNESSW